MEKSEKPSWMKNFDDTYSAPFGWGYWNKSLPHNGGPRGATTARGGHSETSSLCSRFTSSSQRSHRRRSRRTALCVVLTIVALVIAALIGFLVYFLFMMDRPRVKGVPGVSGSVHILNVTYDDDMANSSSKAFTDVAVPFCAELDSYLAKSNYSLYYQGCEVIALQNVADASDCLCLGDRQGNVMVNFQLRFNGSHEEEPLVADVLGIIERGVRKVQFGDALYVLLRHFLVDIRLHWNMPYNAIEAELTLPVYNLNYSRALANNQSSEFTALAYPFCSEVDGIMRRDETSWLADRYLSCRVTTFSKPSSDKGTVAFTLNFEGGDPRPLQQSLLYFLLTGARVVTWYGQLLKMIGTLVVTPFGATSELHPVNVTGPPPNLTYVSVSLPVFNLTLTPELGDPGSALFLNVTRAFCMDIARFYKQSSLKEKFYSCKVLGFRPDDVRVEVQLGFLGDPWAGLESSLTYVIRGHAPDWYYATLHLYRVGSLDVILDRISANGLEFHTSLRVVNMTYSSVLADVSSPEFLHHAVLFCRDLEEFYRKSNFADRFVQCKVKSFSSKPVQVYILLVFKGTNFEGLTSSHISVIKQFAKEVLLNSWWIAYEVGDLLVLPEFQGHSVYPTNLSFSPTPTLTTVAEITTTTVLPEGEMTRAKVTGHLYNFTYDARLLDSGSPLFKSLEEKFCEDVNRVYLNSFLVLSYRGCKIDEFKSNPNEVIFSLFYDAERSRDLEWSIQYVLTQKSPKVNFTLDGLYRVEVLHLGDLFLTLRLVVLEPSPSTSFYLTMVLAPTSTVMMTSTVSPSTTEGPSIMTSTVIYQRGSNVTLRYQLFNFTYLPALGNPSSETFEQYQRLLCLEIQEIFKASRIFYLLYDGCGINRFGFDEKGYPFVDFHLTFNTGYTELLRQSTVSTLETSRVHLYVTDGNARLYEILPVGGLLFILENRTMTSTTISSTMTQTPSPSVMTTSVTYGGVTVIMFYEAYELGFSSDLSDPSSQRFLQHRQKVCSDLERWYKDQYSPFLLTYHGCDLSSFSSKPEGVTFTLTLRTELRPDLARHVRTYLEYVAPKRFVPGYNLLQVGDLDLIIDRYVIDVTPIPFPSDSYTVFVSSPATTQITMTSTPTPTIESSSSVIMSSSLLTVWTAVSLKFGLADFYFTEDLHDRQSQRFLFLQDTFCSDIERFYRNSPLSAYYRGCQIDEFVESPPVFPHKATFTLLMDMPYSQDNVNMTIRTILDQRPQIVLDGYLTIKVGDLYLILTDWVDVSPSNKSTLTTGLPTFSLTSTFTQASVPVTLTPTIFPTPTSSMPMTSSVVTTPPATTTTTTPDPTYYFRMSFEVLNMTWHPDLNVSTSDLFQWHNIQFCSELNDFLAERPEQEFLHYMGCSIDNFGGQPLRVNFSLKFDTLEGLNLERVHSLVISMIKEHALRSTISGIMVHKIGDLSINLHSVHIGNLTGITTVNVYDAIAIEFKYNLYPGNFSGALTDKESYEFKTVSYEFCEDINKIFNNLQIRNIRERYVGCFVNEISTGPLPTLTFTIVFHNNTELEPARLNGIIVYSKEVPGDEMMRIGGLLVTATTTSARRYFLMLDMWSTLPYPYTTTPAPKIVTYVEIRLRVMDPAWRAEMSDPNTAYYKMMADSFCSAVSGWISPVKADYLGCEVRRFGYDPMTIEADLMFQGDQSAQLRTEVDAILFEKPNVDEVAGKGFGLVMGKFYIYEDNLQVFDLRTAPSGLTTTPIGAGTTGTRYITTTLPAPTRPADPCVLGGQFHQHPTLCDRFLQCAGDVAIEIPCSPGLVYLEGGCRTPPPTFQCTPLPG